MAEGPDRLGNWTHGLSHDIASNSERLARLETQIANITEARSTCNISQTKRIERLGSEVAANSKALQDHCQEDQVRQASWSRAEKIVLAVIAASGPLLLALLVWILSRFDVPVASAADAAVQVLSR